MISRRAEAVLDELVANTMVLMANALPLERPDRLTRAMLAALPWGTGTAGAIVAGCARYPSATAVVDDQTGLTYRELARHSDRLASELSDRGVGPGRRVGLLARNHSAFVEALVAVVKTGADLVLLNAEFAPPQLRDVVSSEGVDLVVHDEDCASTAAACDATRCLRDSGPRPVGSALGAVRPRTHQGRMIILTSGTTGRPKGASRGTQGTARGIAGVVSRIPFRARDTQVIAAPLFHAWGLTALLLGLARSSTTVLTRVFDPARTWDAVSRHRAEVLIAVPVMLQRILALGPQALVDRDTSNLKIVASSGSALGAPLAGEILDRLGPVLYNLYGSTEVAVATIATPDDLRRNPGTAGRPVLGARVEILDEEGKPVATGRTGRVFVGSAMRFEGYTNGAGKEQRRGLLCSGDLGHWDADGLLMLDGREDDMVVSGGENVYPAEVEDLLARHAGVAEVAVVGVPDAEFGQSLAAFVVPRAGRDPTADELKRYVRVNLARFKVPRRVEFWNELPRTATGKILRRELVRACTG